MSVEAARETRKYFINCKEPVSDNLISTSDLEAFLNQKVKCHIGKKERLLQIVSNGDSVEVSVTGGFIGKQGIKWQVRRFLHMKKLRSFIKIFAQGPDGFEFRYINVENSKEE